MQNREMQNNDNKKDNNLFNMFLLFLSFLMSGIFITLGVFITLPYKNMSLISAILVTLPFQWLSYLFVALGINFNREYVLFTYIQTLFIRIIISFVLTLLYNHFYLKKPVYFSNFIAFLFILSGFLLSTYVQKSKKNIGKN